MKIFRMVLNRRTFQTRALTAVVFVIVMAAGLLFHPWSFFILISVIHFGCWLEYQKLVQLIDPGYKQINAVHRYGIMIAGWAILLWFADDWYSIFGLQLNEIGPWLGLAAIVIILINDFFIARPVRPKNFAHSVFGLFYLSLSCGLMIDFYPAGAIIADGGFFVFQFSAPLLIIGFIWINDTLAYIVGSFIGKHSLSGISPKKTWEGTIAGILITMIIAFIVAWQTGVVLYTIYFVGVAAVSTIAGTFGDLFESKLKRLAGVKDSGNLMPGHGGFLDRFDSLLLAIPFVWLYFLVFGMTFLL